MLSSNLLKRGYMNINQDEARVIDANERVAKRLQELAAKEQAEKEDFVSGLSAQSIELDAVLEDAEGEGAEFGNVIKGNEAVDGILEAARNEAEEIIQQARLQALKIENDAKAQAELDKIQFMEAARNQGYQDGMEQAAREAELAKEEQKQYCRQLEEEYQKRLDELEPQFVEIITGIYEHIFHVELHSYREILAYLISATMRKVEGSRSFIVHVSKEDFPFVSMQKKQIIAGAAIANCTVEMVEDITLAKNECLIETEGGIFDCGLGTQLSELGQKLRLLSYEK